jgi:hypothetical protein
MWAKVWNRALRVRRQRQPYDFIEPKIRPLVDAMNATGAIHTIASCQGHGVLGKPPYVYFKSSVDIAASIGRLLREDAMSDDAKLHKAWVINGSFDQNYELVFCLHASEYHEKSFSILAPILFWVFRKHLDAELLALVRIVDHAVLLNIGDKDKP